MNPLVLTTCVITLITTEAKRSLVNKGGKESINWNPSMRPVIGSFVLGVFLLGIDEAAPQLTDKFCGLIIITDLVLNGKPLFDYLGSI